VSLLWPILFAMALAVVLGVLVNACLYLHLRAEKARAACRTGDAEPLHPVLAVRGFVLECAALVLALVTWPFARLNPAHQGPRAASVCVVIVPGVLLHRAILWRLGERLAQCGYSVEHFGVPWWWADFAGATVTLRERLETLHAQCPGGLVLLGCGTGGLLARACAVRFSPAGVTHLATVGTPHAGTSLAPWGWTALAQFRPDSSLLAELNARDRLPDRLQVVAVQSEFDAVLVPPTTAYYRGAFNIRLRDTGHVSLLLSRRVASLLIEHLPPADGAIR
jgi:hypothetical protein